MIHRYKLEEEKKDRRDGVCEGDERLKIKRSLSRRVVFSEGPCPEGVDNYFQTARLTANLHRPLFVSLSLFPLSPLSLPSLSLFYLRKYQRVSSKSPMAAFLFFFYSPSLFYSYTQIRFTKRVKSRYFFFLSDVIGIHYRD